MNLIILVVTSTLLKWLMFPLFQTYFKTFPHFSTPLNNIREVKEMFYMYETTGEFYPDTVQIG